VGTRDTRIHTEPEPGGAWPEPGDESELDPDPATEDDGPKNDEVPVEENG